MIPGIVAQQACIGSAEEPGEPIDEHFDKVVLLVSGDDVLTDLSPSGKTAFDLTNLTSVQEGDYFGEGQLKNETSPGVGGRFEASADFNLNSQDWTLEFFFTPIVSGSSSGFMMAMNASCYWSLASNGNLSFSGVGSNGTLIGLQDGVRYHIAMSREGNVNRLYKDGVLIHTATAQSISTTATPGFALFGVPGRPDLQAARGLLEEVRWTKGVARYTGESLDVPTGPYPRSGPPEE